ncbi:hypothetical protein SLEP1_g10856 [Rubroshorea leprosula]|uniref:Leucine-rich repeat-containing N-terminal plant-type domain-containing protein n=1 Tax=Rubroshorea leprosula TaxID=152421 RepID=A0AAV5IKU3_9ROSI|nr:hypothetical protein SLEP1_g10856 [Rubroshorea leprosula]
MGQLIYVFLGFLILTSVSISICNGNSSVACIESEKEALLKFKQGIVDHTNRMATWISDVDCCRWTGIVCDNMTSHVIELHLRSPTFDYYDADEKSKLGGKISPSLLHLKHLSYLDLSNNDFKGIPIPKFFGSFGSLRYLNLSYAKFGGEVPHHLGNLSNLKYLNLHGDKFFRAMYVKNLHWLSSLSSLEHLSLSFVNLSKASNWFPTFSALPSLVELHLSHCQLPPQLHLITSVNLSSLFALSLSGNGLGNLSMMNWVFDLNNLIYLDLSSQISSAIGKMNFAFNLDFSSNSFQGKIPIRCVSYTLESLSLHNCQLYGHLTNKLGNFKNLRKLDLSDNSISGSIPISIGELSSLKALYLLQNNLKGNLPESFGQLVNVEYVDISNNFLEGTLSEAHFFNLTKLSTLYAYGNPLTLDVDPSWIPPFQSHHLCLGYWHLGPQFPHWLSSQTYLRSLDISNSGISSTIPCWFSNFSLQLEYLDLSDNQIHGQIPVIPSFEGPLPWISSFLTLLDLSNNNLSGSLFNFLCSRMDETMEMGFLNLENNFFSGELPNCWTKWPYLEVIVLGDNKFIGKIPNSIGTLQSLRSLHLRKNNFSREIPVSIRNCTALEILDFGENELDGNISSWLGYNLPNLKILSLHSNKFSGHIPKELCALNFLQILDLGHNNLSGSLPRCISNLSAMVYSTNDSFGNNIKYKFGYFIENAFLVMKGQILEYDMTLNLVRILDFSYNSLSGNIPWEITSLHGLQSLNLSHNLLIGRIPSNIGDMIFLESLDLSANKLLGSIPQSMSKLSFLNCLNLSDNQLTRAIPSSTQLQSFDASSYVGNQLCGFPLADNCSEINHVVPSTRNRKGKDMDGLEVSWLFVSMTLGFSVGFWSVLSSLVISRRWRYAYYQYLDEMWWKVNHLCV